PEIGHAVSSGCAAVDLKRPEGAGEAGIDHRLAALREQHFGDKLSPRQKAGEGPTYGLRMTTQRRSPALSPAADRGEILIPEESEFPERLQPSLYQSAEQREISSRRRIANLSVNVQVQHTHAGQLGCVESLVEVARHPLQVGPLLPKALDAVGIEIDTDEPARRQHAFSLQQVEGQQPSRPHEFAPVAAEAGAVAVFPEEVCGLAENAEIAGPACHLPGIVEGVALAVGEIGHVRLVTISGRSTCPARRKSNSGLLGRDQ